MKFSQKKICIDQLVRSLLGGKLNLPVSICNELFATDFEFRQGVS